MYLTKTSKRQSFANKIAVFFLKLFGFNITTVAASSKDRKKIDYVVFSKGWIKWDKSPNISHQA